MKLEKIVLATGNTGKVKEFRQLFETQHIQIVPQSEFDLSSVPETGTTFVENAIIKARHASKHTGLPAIADDSGLVVDALGGAPGIYSSRYAGTAASDSDNLEKLLDVMSNQSERCAHFHCCLVFMRSADDPVPIICEGQWRGEIARAPMGNEGFGYDPVFIDSELKLSAAQLEKTVKNQRSHRGIALQRLLTAIRGEFA